MYSCDWGPGPDDLCWKGLNLPHLWHHPQKAEMQSFQKFVTLWRPAAFGDFWEKNTETHVALRGNISGLVSTTYLVNKTRQVL